MLSATLPARMPDPLESPDRTPHKGELPSGPLTREEFASLFQHSARMLWTIAAGVLGSPSEADDVLQEACIQALGKLEQFERGTSFTAWMGRFVRNVARNHARRLLRRGLVGTDGGSPLEELPAAASRDDAPIDDAGCLQEDQASFDDRLMSELREIASVPRACLLLRTLLELSYAEISEALEIPEGTAASHVHRTRNLLKRRLSRELPSHRRNGKNGHARILLVEAVVHDALSTIDAEPRR